MNLQNRENLSCFQLDVVELGNEHRGHTLEDGRPVHVDSRPNGEDEPADSLVHTVVFLNALHHGGKGCRAGGEKRPTMTTVLPSPAHRLLGSDPQTEQLVSS